MQFCARYVLIEKTEDYSKINGYKPQVAREAVEHPAQQRLLSRETRHVAVGTVAEVSEHKQQNTQNVMHKVGIAEHYARSHTKKNRQYSDDVRMNAQFIPENGKHQSYGTGEIDIEPFLCVFAFKRCLKHLLECCHKNL